MLAGIKTGKKKKKVTAESEPLIGDGATPTATVDQSPNNQENLSVADRLRESLATGNEAPITAYTQQSSILDQLERRGRIESTPVSSSSSSNPVIVQFLPPTALQQKKEEDMTIQELVAKERHDTKMSWDEQMTRTAVRLGKNKKRKLRTGQDSDEEVEELQRYLPTTGDTADATAKVGTKRYERTMVKPQERDRHRLLHEQVQQDKITSQCAWWIESSSFRKHRLLALGDYVSLVMAPPNASLIPGHHFYIVPIKHAPSLVHVMAEDDMSIWKEIQRFQTSLQNLYARQGKSVIMLETVLDHSKGLWQTKLEVIPIPFDVLQDAPMFFSSAMREQTEEWGTHTKLMKVSQNKPLSSVIPKGFPYFSVEWGNMASSPTATGYAQIIESPSFRHDFGVDTVAGMLELDPIRLRRQQKYSHEEERQQIKDFLTLWDKVDWTKELDK